jgi:hypothetical protein
VATSIHATIEEFLEAVFSMQSVLRLYNDDQLDKPESELVLKVPRAVRQ